MPLHRPSTISQDSRSPLKGLTDERKRYEYAIGSSSTITYSAPSGFHADAVTGLALATTGRGTPTAHAASWPRCPHSARPAAFCFRVEPP